jgi:hypothetical protein
MAATNYPVAVSRDVLDTAGVCGTAVRIVHKTLALQYSPYVLARAMQDSTDPLWGRPGTPRRISVLLGVVFALSLLAFGYGLAVFLGGLPAGWGALAAIQYVLLVLGGLLSSLLALVAGRQWRRGEPRPLGGRQALSVSLVAAAISLGAVLLVERLRRGEFALPHLIGWTTFGLLAVSLQFAAGAVGSERQLRRTLLAECTLVFAGTFAYLTITPVEPHLLGNLVFAGAACLLLVLVGGPLYLLGTHLSRTPS